MAQWVGDADGDITKKTCGFLFDSEAVSKAAAAALERLYPQLTNVPCQAHCGASLMSVRHNEAETETELSYLIPDPACHSMHFSRPRGRNFKMMDAGR